MDLIAGGSGSGTQSIKLKGSGSASVTSDANGVITVTGATIPAALKNPEALTVGSKTYDGSSAVSITAADLGLSNALHFIGVKDLLPPDYELYTNGDVILVDSKEYVYNDNEWIELGDGDSHAFNSITISAGEGLIGGGDLTSDRIISHGNTSDVSDLVADGRKYVTGLTFDAYGHVTGTTTGTETVVDTTYALQIEESDPNYAKVELQSSKNNDNSDIEIRTYGGTTLNASGNSIMIASPDAGSGLVKEYNDDNQLVFNHINVVTPTYVGGIRLDTVNHITDYGDTITAFEPKYDENGHIVYSTAHNYTLPAAQEIPNKLPNPQTLFINGIEYDGTQNTSVRINEGNNVSIT